MDAIEKAKQAASRIRTTVVEFAKKAMEDSVAQPERHQVPPPASPIVSGRVTTWNPTEYIHHVDDSKLYRKDRDKVERMMVRTTGDSVSLRSRVGGSGSSQDRYLSVVAEVAEYEAKQGLSGTVTAGGLPQVENKQQLKPLLARGLTYDQGEFERMARSNPTARNAIRATVERVAQASEYYAAPDVDWEALAYAPGMSAEARVEASARLREATERAAEVLNLEWYHNPDVDAQQVIREQAYAMVPGFVLHEFGIDPRLQGRRKTTFIEHRAQSSVLRWVWDQRERWCGVVQNASGSPGLLADIPVSGITVQGMPVIDARKLLLVTNQRIGLNLEGLSDLRAAWYASQGKSEWFISALMHRRKWGNGFPLFKTDPESAKSKQVSDSIAKAAQDFFYSGQAYMGLPPGVTMEMLEFDSDTGFITAMEYFDKEILRSLGALATEIGQSGGSYNLMDVQQSERLRQLQGYAVQIKSSRRTWIEAACSILIGDLAVLPELRIEGIMTRSDREVLDVWSGVAQVRNALKPDGSPVYTETDIRSLCDTVGVPFTSAEEMKELQGSEEEAKSAPLLVGALQVAQQVLGALVASEVNPVPIAPEAAVLLLSSAGVPEEVARAMVSAQIGRPVEKAVESKPSEVAVQSIVNKVDAENSDQKTEVPQTEAEAPTTQALLSRLRAKTLDDVDTKPTTGMAKVAKRALEWRKEHGRGGTEVGVARARDIASRRNLSEDTVRRMKAYFDRHQKDSKAEGWNIDEDGFPSAGRVAWDLWGGDGGWTWSEKKVAEFNRIRDTKAKTSLHAKKVVETVFGRDAQAFDTFRGLTALERHVAWARLYQTAQFEAEMLTVLAEGIAAKQRKEFLRQASGLIASGDVKALSALRISSYDDYLEAFRKMLTSWSQLSRKETLAEIKSQVGGLWSPSVEAETFPATLEEIVEAEASLLAKVVDEDWQKRMSAIATTEASGLRQLEPLKSMPVPSATWEKNSIRATSQVQNLTREEVARTEGPPIKSAQYSAIMDRMTCGPCASMDGKEFKFGSVEYLKNRPPNPECMSRLGSYGNVCRCVYVYEFDTTKRQVDVPGSTVQLGTFSG